MTYPPYRVLPGNSEVPLVDLEERRRSNTYLEHSDYTVAEALHEIARQIPDHVAIESVTDRITFGELASASEPGRQCAPRPWRG